MPPAPKLEHIKAETKIESMDATVPKKQLEAAMCAPSPAPEPLTTAEVKKAESVK